MGHVAKTFRDLEVYQNALSLAVAIHEFSKSLPPRERYALADQMRRAARSVCQNIAETWRKRRYKAAFIAKLSDSETETAELQSCLDIALRLEYMDQQLYQEFDRQCEVVLSPLVRMMNDADKWCTL